MKEWILCKERLPEEGEGMKWVTVRGHDVIIPKDGETIQDAYIRIMSERWVTQAFYSHEDKSWDNEYGFPLIVQPIAWMDIDVPAPYDGYYHEDSDINMT